jgi:hypothetical protein
MIYKNTSCCILFMLVLTVLFTEKTYGDDFRFAASLDLREEYNDNVFFTEADQEEDFRTIISPKIELSERTERLEARADARVAQNIWAENDELNDLDQFYRGKLQYLCSPRFSVSAEGGYTRDSQIDRDITATGLLAGTSIRERKRFGASGNYMMSELTSIALSYEYEEEDFNDQDRTDFDLHSARLSLNRNLSDLMPLTAGRVDFGFARYDSSPSELDSYSMTIGGSYELHETLSVNLDVGARYTRSEFNVQRSETVFVPFPPFLVTVVTQDKEKTDNWGGLGQLAISYTGELTTANLVAFHDLRPASGRSGSVQRTYFRLDVGRRFTYQLRGSLSAEYFLNKSDRGDFSAEDIDEETFQINPRLRYSFTEDLSIEAGYSYLRVVNDVTDEEPDRNLVLVRVFLRLPLIE